jgi:glycine/D-amino acid oxidase-like deaminating enzyme
VEQVGGKVQSVQLADGARVQTRIFVDAAGPFLRPVGRLLHLELPVYNEVHLKLALKDHLGILDRRAPLVILTDPQKLSWSPEEVEWLREADEYNCLLDELPGGLHTRPEGGADSPVVLALWEYHTRQVEPVLQKIGRPRIDGGYYTRTIENRPLIDRLPVEGAFVIGALSGFGLMSACAAGELLACHVTGDQLPAYAPAFSLKRYEDPAYQARLATWGPNRKCCRYKPA